MIVTKLSARRLLECYSTQMQRGRDWNAKTRVAFADGKVVRYSVLYLRQTDDDWYDEIRYDSHDRTRGRFQEAPHFHMKLRSAFKSNTEVAEAEIRGIVETVVPGIEAVVRS